MAETLMGTHDEIHDWLAIFPLKSINILYFWGAGVSLLPLKAWLEEDPARRLIVFEEDPKSCAAFHPRVVFLPKNDWIKVIDPYLIHPDAQKFYVGTLPHLHEEKDFLIFKNTITCRIENFAIIREEALTFGGIALANFYSNVFQLPNSYLGSSLFGQFSDIPAIVVGAGPSLNRNMAALEKYQGKALIFSGGTAMNALSGSKVIPNFGIAVDPNTFQMSRLMMNQTFETPTFYATRLFTDAMDLIQGNKIYLSSFIPGTLPFWFEEELGLKPLAMDAGMSVTTLGLVHAALLGCNPIILVGVDLAYSGGLSYASSVVSHAFHTMRQSFITKQTQDDLLETNDIHGNKIYTLWKWLEESFWISNFAKNNSDRWFINATEGGLGFEGVDNIPFEAIMERLPAPAHDLERMAYEKMFMAKMPETVTKERIVELFKSLRESFLEVLKELDENGVEAIENALCYKIYLKRFINDYQKIYQFDRENDRDAYDKKFHDYIKAGCRANVALIEKVLDMEEAIHPKKMGQAASAIPASKVILDGEKRVRVCLNEKDGFREGPCAFYTKSGSLSSFLHYKDGRLNGEASLFDGNGNLYRRLHFKEGRWEGREEWFTEEGKVWLEAEYSDSKPVNEAKIWDGNGQLREWRLFKEGELVDVRYYLMNGQEVPVNPTKDYFELVVESTANLQKALEELFIKVQQFAGKDMPQNLEQLKALQERLVKEIEEAKHREAIWKSDATKDVIKKMIDVKNEPMVDSIDKTLKELKKNEPD